MSKTYTFVSYVEHNLLVEVADIMTKYVGKQESINPDMSFAGVMPLHLAVEEGFTDMAAYLIHWKASKTRLDGSRKYPLQYAQARAKNPKTKENGETLVKLLTDDKFHAAYMEELLPRLNAMRQKRYAEVRAQYKRMVVTACALLFALVAALHLALLYRPELLRARLSERLIREMWSASPIFKRLGLEYVPAGATRTAAAASSGRFDEL